MTVETLAENRVAVVLPFEWAQDNTGRPWYGRAQSKSNCHHLYLSVCLRGSEPHHNGSRCFRAVQSREPGFYEDIGLHEAGTAEGRSVEAQRERRLDSRRRL